MSSVIFLVDHSAGKVAKATGELATFAKSIGESVAVVFASNPAEIISQLNTFSIDKVITVSGDWDKNGPAVIADGLAQIIASKKPSAVLITSSASGKEIAGRVAVKTGSGIITDAIGVDKDLITTQSVFGGSTTVHASVTTGTPIITLRSNSIEPVVTTSSAAIEEFAVTLSDSSKLATVTSATPVVEGGRPDLTEASVVVSGGRGTNGDFKPVEALADALGAAVERPVLQLMLVGIHTHIKWDKQVKQFHHNFMLQLESLELFNIALVCKHLRQLWQLIKILRLQFLRSQILL